MILGAKRLKQLFESPNPDHYLFRLEKMVNHKFITYVPKEELFIELKNYFSNSRDFTRLEGEEIHIGNLLLLQGSGLAQLFSVKADSLQG